MTKSEKEFPHPPQVSFDNIDYDDPVQLLKAQESMLKEQYVKQMQFKTVRKALENCFQVSGGSNFQEDCKDLADLYMNLMPGSKIEGFLGYQRNDVSK